MERGLLRDEISERDQQLDQLESDRDATKTALSEQIQALEGEIERAREAATKDKSDWKTRCEDLQRQVSERDQQVDQLKSDRDATKTALSDQIQS